MGIRLIIPGSDFSVNGIKSKLTEIGFNVQDGYYQRTTGIFLPEGGEWNEGRVSNWCAFKVSCEAGKQYCLQCKTGARFRIVWFNSSDEYIGNDIISDSVPFTALQDGFFAINAAQIPSSPDVSDEFTVSVSKEELEKAILIMM